MGISELAYSNETRKEARNETVSVGTEAALSIMTVTKSFGSVMAVKDVSFCVNRGEIFGMVGPNGAGKTTLIRMIMNIFRPDTGEILVSGRRLAPDNKDKIGYLPEERGLYTKQRVQPVLEYFAELKGLSRLHARANTERWLKRLELWEVRGRRIQELSKGNQQKVQLISAVIADPEIVILDEPISGLDPVNARLLISVVRELASEGKTILFSSHQMNLVENLCQRVLMIHKGEAVLYGQLDEIRRSHSEHTVIVQTDIELDECPLTVAALPCEQGKKVRLRKDTSAEDLLRWLLQRGAQVTFFEQLPVRLEDIYIKIVEESR